MQLTIPQAAELLRTTEGQVHRWIRDLGLPAIVFNEQLRLNRVDLLEWAQRQGFALAETAPDGAGGTSHLAEALERGGIHRGLFGSTQAEVIAGAVDRLQLPPNCDRDLLREMILARAAQGTTAIGDGLALPHARYPFVADVRRPILGLCFLSAPVDFRAPDHRPVSAMFVLVSPSVRIHLQTLASLARALTGGLRELVIDRATDEQILAFCRRSDVGTPDASP